MNKPTYTIKPLYLGEMTRYEKSMHTFTFGYGVKMHSPYLAFLVQGDGKNILVNERTSALPNCWHPSGQIMTTFWWTPAPKIWRSLKDITAMWRQTCPQRFTCSRSWKSTD